MGGTRSSGGSGVGVGAPPAIAIQSDWESIPEGATFPRGSGVDMMIGREASEAGVRPLRSDASSSLRDVEQLLFRESVNPDWPLRSYARSYLTGPVKGSYIGPDGSRVSVNFAGIRAGERKEFMGKRESAKMVKYLNDKGFRAVAVENSRFIGVLFSEKE